MYTIGACVCGIGIQRVYVCECKIRIQVVHVCVDLK